MNSLGLRLKKLRVEKKLTQEQFAKIICISRGSLSMIEINRREPDNETLQSIANFFNVSVDYLLGRTTKKNYEEQNPTDAELEEILTKSNVYFDGAPLDEEDKEDLVNFLRFVVKKNKNIKE